MEPEKHGGYAVLKQAIEAATVMRAADGRYHVRATLAKPPTDVRRAEGYGDTPEEAREAALRHALLVVYGAPEP